MDTPTVIPSPEVARRRRRPKQLGLPGVDQRPAKAEKRWGGRRKGAGRKPRTPGRPGVPHVKRPSHDWRHPIHVTVRVEREIPSLRAQLVHSLVREVLRGQKKRAYERGFQIVHFSIQVTHLHLIAEANDVALRAGVSGFVIAFARRLNRLLGRKGRVFRDRYHRHDLETPTEVRNALRYVFQNWKKHSIVKGDGVADPYSSAVRFPGWSSPAERILLDTEPWPSYRHRTWLLYTGWRKAGVLDIDDRPGKR